MRKRAAKATTAPATTKAALRHINLRVTVAERVELDQRRMRAGMPGLNQYIRACLFGREAPHHLEEIRANEPTLIGAAHRTHCISVRVNAGELATIEARRAQTGIAELGTYVRKAVLAQRAPSAVVPEVNRTAWLELAEQLVRLQTLAGSLEAIEARTWHGLVGRGRLDDLLSACLEELRALQVTVQALRRSLLGSEHLPVGRRPTQRRTRRDREEP